MARRTVERPKIENGTFRETDRLVEKVGVKGIST